MSAKELVEKYRHEFGGLVADAFVVRREGSELSIAMRSSFRKIDDLLLRIHSEFAPDVPKPATPKRTP